MSELYNNGGILRVFGCPKILEIVYNPVNPDFTKEAGIYNFRDYIRMPEGKEVWERPKEKETKPPSDEEADKPTEPKTEEAYPEPLIRQRRGGTP